MKPETPLPWNEIPGYDWPGEFESEGSFEMNDRDIPYILHACNAYPGLVDVVRELRKYMDPDISNYAYYYSERILRQLGEL